MVLGGGIRVVFLSSLITPGPETLITAEVGFDYSRQGGIKVVYRAKDRRGRSKRDPSLDA